MNKIIIDTDPWVDDALAIMYAIKAWFNISWITTVFWNTDIDNTTKNTLKILSILDKNIPIYKWEAKPLKVEPTFAKSHWDWWFWWYNIAINQKIQTKNAISYLIDQLEKVKEKITIICLWPTTNIAKLALSRPDLIKNIWKLIILWWVIWEKWNISPYAEFNVYNDPDALKNILWLDINTYLISINICRKVYFTLDDFNKINNKNISLSIKEITKQYIDYYQNDKEYWNFAWWVMYDLLATTFLTNEEFFTYKDSYINVITDNISNIWETIEDYSKKPNCKLITSVNWQEIKKLFFNTLNW